MSEAKSVAKRVRGIYDFEKHREHHRSFEERYEDMVERVLIAERALREDNGVVLERVLVEAVRETGKTRLPAREEETK